MNESESVTAARSLVLTVGEAATLLGISRAHAYELVSAWRAGAYPVRSPGGGAETAIDELIANA